MSSIADITPKQLRKAANLKEKIEALQARLAVILGSPAEATGDGVVRKRHKMSAAGRARIAAAAKARWARIKGTSMSTRHALKPDRRRSAATRARLSAMAKARWRKARAAGRTTL